MPPQGISRSENRPPGNGIAAGAKKYHMLRFRGKNSYIMWFYLDVSGRIRYERLYPALRPRSGPFECKTGFTALQHPDRSPDMMRFLFESCLRRPLASPAALWNGGTIGR